MDNSKNEKKPGNKNAIIIVLALSILISLIISVVAIVSVIKGDSSDNNGGYDYSYVENPDLYQTTQNNLEDYLTENANGEQTPESNPGYNGQQGSAGSDNKKTTKNVAVENYEKLSKNGDNMLSDHYENQYIKMVAGEYGVDTDLLVAIYSVPDTGNNFVLEFSGKKDSAGNIIKSPDTLKKVYQIDLDRNIKVATANGVGNVGVSYAEGIFCFNMVKTLVMEQYPDYFTGIN